MTDTTPTDGAKNPETPAAATPEMPAAATGNVTDAAAPAAAEPAADEPAELIEPAAPVADARFDLPAPFETATAGTAVLPPLPVHTPMPVYVAAPRPPQPKSNRPAGILIALLSSVVFAVVFSLIVFLYVAVTSTTVTIALSKFVEFISLPVFYVPVIFFFLGFALLVTIVNRAGWWAYVLFGFLVAVVVYFAFLLGALLAVQAWNLTPAEAAGFLRQQFISPYAFAAAIAAREVPVWAGAWIARRGRAVTAANAAAEEEYERVLAEGPQLTPQL